MIHAPSSFRTRSLFAIVAALLFPLGIAGQSPDGFLFGRPSVRLDLFGGLSVPRAGSQVFDFTSEELTLERDDFRSAAWGLGIGYRMTEWFDLAVEVARAEATVEAEYRELEGTDGLPIIQEASFRRTPLSLTARVYPLERGRSVGRLAWVPRSWVPYAGGGVGVTRYEFAREGEFVDSQTLEIFYDRVTWDGAAPMAHVLAGMEWSLSPRLLVRGEGRYTWGSGDPVSSEFEGFDDLDLAGLTVTAGLSVRF